LIEERKLLRIVKPETLETGCQREPQKVIRGKTDCTQREEHATARGRV